MSIEGLEEILSAHLQKGHKILDSRITSLVGPGENWGGELLKIEITTEDETTKNKNTVHAVGKKIPPVAALQEIFNVQLTFKAEMLFYEKIVPVLQDFQRRQGVQDVIDCFAKFYGGRLNLNGSTTVNEDAVMVMENLIIDGYKNLDRYVGYNLQETQIVLKELANLHATTLAIKLKKPDLFNKEIKPLCCNSINQIEDDPFLKMHYVIEDILLENKKTAPWIAQVKKVWDKYSQKFDYVAREPFATIAHCDLWGNNVMIKHENGQATGVKIVDFQLYNYKSPVMDVLNFLTTSVQNDVVINEFDDLLKFYHSQFTSKLNQLGVDTEPFSYTKFQEELKIDAKLTFVWVFLFIPLIVFGKNTTDALNPAEFQFDQANLTKYKNVIDKEAVKRLYFVVETFGKKGWLNSD